MIIPPLQSPRQDGSNGGLIVYLSIYMIGTVEMRSLRQGGSNGGQIIKIGFFININRINSVNNSVQVKKTFEQ
jgi:hypothetical protein